MEMRSTCSVLEPTSNGSACAPTPSPSSNARLQSEPPTHSQPPPVLDAGEILERIAAVQEENLKRLDDDVDILKAYLKTQSAPRTAIEALEGLTVEQHVSWKKAVARIEKLLG